MENLSRTKPHHLITVLPKPLPQGLISRAASSSLDWGSQESSGPWLGKGWCLERYECAGIEGKKSILISSPCLRHRKERKIGMVKTGKGEQIPWIH